MITQNMRLNSKSDARQWASDFDLIEQHTENLAEWIWNYKPQLGCCYAEHPLAELSDDNFYDVIDGVHFNPFQED